MLMLGNRKMFDEEISVGTLHDDYAILVRLADTATSFAIFAKNYLA